MFVIIRILDRNVRVTQMGAGTITLVEVDDGLFSDGHTITNELCSSVSIFDLCLCCI